jgi:endonuclease/exonuclease/phosphatase family metal-dependent hydrolase
MGLLRLASRVRAFTRYAPGRLVPAFDDPHVKMLHLHPPIGLPLLIVAAHLPSKLRGDDQDQGYRIRRLRSDIEAQEARSRHQNTLVIGDLNVNPFEDALTAADGLHGVDGQASGQSSRARGARQCRWPKQRFAVRPTDRACPRGRGP